VRGPERQRGRIADPQRITDGDPDVDSERGPEHPAERKRVAGNEPRATERCDEREPVADAHYNGDDDRGPIVCLDLVDDRAEHERSIEQPRAVAVDADRDPVRGADQRAHIGANGRAVGRADYSRAERHAGPDDRFIGFNDRHGEGIAGREPRTGYVLPGDERRAARDGADAGHAERDGSNAGFERDAELYARTRYSGADPVTRTQSGPSERELGGRRFDCVARGEGSVPVAGPGSHLDDRGHRSAARSCAGWHGVGSWRERECLGQPEPKRTGDRERVTDAGAIL
jgi:hypothetical protein